MTQEPNFDASETDFQSVMDIVDRAIKVDPSLDRMKCQMDLLAAHNSCPLQLADLTEASPTDFNHDVFGIFCHINRKTGELGDCFLPRYAQ